MMLSKNALFIFAVLVCSAATVHSAPQAVVVNQGMDLSAGTMQIGDTEHTAEYLAATGGSATSGAAGSYRDLSGNWTFDLREQVSGSMNSMELRLFQWENVIFGKGVFREGLRSEAATAEGTLLSGNTMNLNVVTLDGINLYRLTINSPDGNTTSGTFSLYTPARDEPVKGSLSGSRTDARRLS
jgi:hypothetical protein